MANMQMNKTPMPEQEPNIRNANFKEVALGYTLEQAINEAQRCLQCKNPLCVSGCPVGIPIPQFLGKVAEGDIADYARLCRDEELLLYWGYDYRLDYNGKDDRFFFDMAEAEFDSGVALTLAVRSGAKLVGSLEFYAFDFHGSAELDVRIFPHEQGKGYASCAVEGAIDIAKQMGLTKLCATVMNNNAHSLALFEKYSTQKRANKKTTVFTIDI